jgi:hypothetical protein
VCQIRTTRAEECWIRGPNLRRVAKTLRFDGINEPPEFGEKAVDGGKR